MPLGWLALTSFKSYEDTITAHAKFVPGTEAGGARAEGSVKFAATVDAYRNLSQPVAGTSRDFYHYLGNSVVIGVLSTLAPSLWRRSAPMAFRGFGSPGRRIGCSSFCRRGSCRPSPWWCRSCIMYRRFGLENTHLGLILLYTSFNLSLAVWLMKGFIDEIPRAFEEAALVDGYSRLAAFVRVIVPQAATGMAVTAVFCLISSWNEFGFAMTLNNYEAKTVPVYFAGLQGNIDGVPWPQIAAGMMIFVAPIVLFTVLVRKHLLRGVTFGTIKQ